MPDDKRMTGDLALQAFLYASAELDDEQRAAFEQLLGQDQAARDALAQAVPLTLSPASPAPRPDPAYRQRVRDRLRPVWWRRLIGRRAYRGHPLLWAGLGAAAAVLLTLAVVPLLRPAPAPQETIRIVQVPPKETPDETAPAPSGTMAYVWADLNNHDHLSRALAEANRRKTRSEDRRLTRGEERPGRKPGRTSPR
ncbi:MAG TPA: hypothetical protein VKD72_16910 [Gemmataceae bacterium]|nr:hypothetical protein [Gemmataceae bacterium]